jgi:5'/3'-nucleotidase SurE
VNILLTNDDGLAADGLVAAYTALVARGHRVTACAPDRERSGQSQAVTLRVPLEVTAKPMPDGAEGYAISGTPADCSRLGFAVLAPGPVDLVISGINNDCNLGYDANYSGTVAAALEAAGAGLPSLAVSLECSNPFHWEAAAGILVEAAERHAEWGIPPGVMVNINIPSEIADSAWAWTTLNQAPSPDDYLPAGPMSWIRRRLEGGLAVAKGSDIDLHRQGRVTLSPIAGVAHDGPTLARLQALAKGHKRDQKPL